MGRLRAYWLVAVTAAREDGANPARLISTVLQQIVRVLLVVAIYRTAYRFSGNHALDFTNAMWTIGLCFAFFLNLGVRNIYIPVEREIKDGTVEAGLIKPLDWRLSKFMYLLGKNGVEFLVQIVVLPVVLLIAVGPPSFAHLTPLIAAVFLPFFVMSIITAASLFMMVGLATFWLNDAKSVFRIVDKMGLIFCGTFVPLALLPDAVQAIARFSPFGIYAAPTRIFDPTIIPVLWPTFLAGLFWTAVMLGLCHLMWQRATQRIEVNGG